jgi:hypothetical protein
MPLSKLCWVIVNETIPITQPGMQTRLVTNDQRPIVACHRNSMRLWARTLHGNDEKINILGQKLLDFLGFLADLGVDVAEDYEGKEFMYRCC